MAVQSAPAPTITSGVSVIDNAVNPSLSEHFAAVPTASVNPLYVWTEIAGWVWLIGLEPCCSMRSQAIFGCADA